ncbi:hypothetical protein ENBRE01_1047 [Enteropsectra breve]|nr:hypothetical protein ENBRE01_1047 [Enteropsectra breve]
MIYPMFDFGGEKKDVFDSNPKSVAGTVNMIEDGPENNQSEFIKQKKIGYFKKVIKNLDDYKMAWFILMLVINVVGAIVEFFWCQKDLDIKISSFIGSIMINAISFLGIANFKIGFYKIGLISVTLFESLIILLCLKYAAKNYLDSEIFWLPVLINVLCGFLQLGHACFATPKSVPLDI